MTACCTAGIARLIDGCITLPINHICRERKAMLVTSVTHVSFAIGKGKGKRRFVQCLVVRTSPLRRSHSFTCKHTAPAFTA